MVFWNRSLTASRFYRNGLSYRGRLAKSGVGAALVVVLGLIAAGCGGSAVSREAAGIGVLELPGLVSAVPVSGLESGGGGLEGSEWSVWGIPGALDAADPGLVVSAAEQVSVGGVRVRLTALPGQAGGYRFKVFDQVSGVLVWDSGDAASNGEACRVGAGGVGCVVPVGVLRVGGVYRVVSTAGGVDEARVFSVSDTPVVSGAQTLSVQGRGISTGAGSVGLGMGFSTADQGVTAATANRDGFGNGLPDGWHWVGLPGGFSRIGVSDAAGYQGYSKLLTVRTGSAPMLLGCKPAGVVGEVCSSLDGSVAGSGYTATVAPGGGSIVLAGQDGSAYSFDAGGRVVGYSGPGALPVGFEYVGDSGLFSRVRFGPDLVWEVSYPGGALCPGLDGAGSGFIDNPAELVCAVKNPFGDVARFSYTAPGGANPRLSRVVAMSAECAPDPGDCGSDQAQVNDFGWDDHNRPFLHRDSANSAGVLNGNLKTGSDPMSDPTLTRVEYDSLGRVAKTVSPSMGLNVARVGHLYAYAEGDQVQAKFAPATRTITTVTQASGVPDSSAVSAFDDSGRGIHSQTEDGSVSSVIWHPRKLGLQLGSMAGGSIQGSVYDFNGLATGTYSGPVDAFGPACRPAAAARDDDSCAPVKAAQVVSYEQKVDEPVSALGGPGLVRRFYAGRADFTGQPGLGLAGYSGGGFKFLPDDQATVSRFSVRLSGGIVLPQTDVTIAVGIGDDKVTGTVWVDGGYCGMIVNRAGKCVYSNSKSNPYSTAKPISIRIDLARDSDQPFTSAQASFKVEDPKSRSGKIDLKPTDFSPRTIAITQTTSIDRLANGEKFSTTTANLNYGNPYTAAPTSAVVSGQTLDSPTVTLPASTTVYEPGEFGGIRQAFTNTGAGANAGAKTGSGGDAGGKTGAGGDAGGNSSNANANANAGANNGSGWKYEYWGYAQTPAEYIRDFPAAGMGDLGQFPDGVVDTPQRALVRAVTDPSGRTTRMVYDQAGQVACRQTPSVGPAWSCTWRDFGGRVVKERVQADNGSAEQTSVYRYQPGKGLDAPYLTITTSTVTGDQSALESVSAMSQTGLLLAYKDPVGTRSWYKYDPLGQVNSLMVQPVSDGPDKLYEPKILDVQRDSYGSPVKHLLDDRVIASYRYGMEAGQRVYKGTDYPGGLSVNVDIDDSKNTITKQWELNGKPVLTDKVRYSMANTLTGADFADEKLAFGYDGIKRLTGATIAGVDFTYAYDPNNELTCAAAAIPNPAKAACPQLAGSTTYNFENTHPASIATGTGTTNLAYDKTGNLTSYQGTTMAYNAANQMASSSNQNGERIDYTRDATGRPISIKAKLLTNPVSSLPIPSPSNPPQPPATAQPPTPVAAATPLVTGNPQALPAPETQPASTGSTPVTPQTTPAPATTTPAPSDPTPTLVETKTTYGYASPGGPAVISYTTLGPVSLLGPPGDARTDGVDWYIGSTTGNGLAVVDSDGQTLNKLFTGPYGEATVKYKESDAGKSSELAGLLSDRGARTLVPSLYSFAQPDPSVTGSPTSQYSYTSTADPINYGDPTGMYTEERNSFGLPPWARGLITFAGMAAMNAASGSLVSALVKRGWFKTAGFAVKAAIFAIYAIAAGAAGFAALVATNLGHLDQITTAGIVEVGAWSLLSGGLGVAAHTAKVATTQTGEPMAQSPPTVVAGHETNAAQQNLTHVMTEEFDIPPEMLKAQIDETGDIGQAIENLSGHQFDDLPAQTKKEISFNVAENTKGITFSQQEPDSLLQNGGAPRSREKEINLNIGQVTESAQIGTNPVQALPQKPKKSSLKPEGSSKQLNPLGSRQALDLDPTQGPLQNKTTKFNDTTEYMIGVYEVDEIDVGGFCGLCTRRVKVGGTTPIQKTVINDKLKIKSMKQSPGGRIGKIMQGDTDLSITLRPVRRQQQGEPDSRYAEYVESQKRRFESKYAHYQSYTDQNMYSLGWEIHDKKWNKFEAVNQWNYEYGFDPGKQEKQ